MTNKNFKVVTTYYYDQRVGKNVDHKLKSFINMDHVYQISDSEIGSTILFINGGILSVKESYGNLLND